MSYPLLFGEILYDHFSDGSWVLGGAPFNAAWHLKGFGFNPRILSNIGRDRLGDQIIAEVDAWQLDRSLIQRDDKHSTGAVEITLEAGQPTFDIVEDVAYDHIDTEVVLPALIEKPPALLYHGTLAIRHSVSRKGLLALRNAIRSPVFVDINLRPPWWNEAVLEQILTGTTWLKLNQDELEAIGTIKHCGDGDHLSQAQSLLERYNMEAIIVTLGDKGAFIVDRRGTYHSAPVQVTKLVDTVGAGDGFSAVAIAGLLNGWEYPEILKQATIFAAEICRQRGAISTDSEFYRRFAPEGLNATTR